MMEGSGIPLLECVCKARFFFVKSKTAPLLCCLLGLPARRNKWGAPWVEQGVLERKQKKRTGRVSRYIRVERDVAVVGRYCSLPHARTMPLCLMYQVGGG